MNITLEYIINKFKPEIINRGSTPIYNVNRTIMAQTLGELRFKEGAEIGVSKGHHSRVLCENNPGVKLYCIDIWEKELGYEEYEDPQNCFEETKRILSPFNCNIIRKYSMDAVADFADDSLDFVYIDGAHDFRSVADDLCEWSRKVRVGGVVFGHDYKRHSRANKHRMHVKYVVDAYTYSHGVMPWFVLTNDITDPTFGKDNPGWMFVRQDSDRIL